MGFYNIFRIRFSILLVLAILLSCSSLHAGWEVYFLDGNTTPTPGSSAGLLDYFASEKYPITATKHRAVILLGMPAHFQSHEYVETVSYEIGGVRIGCYNGGFGSEEFTGIAIRDNDYEWLNTVLKHYQFSSSDLYEGDESMAVAHLAGRLAAREVKQKTIDSVVSSFVELVGNDSNRDNLNIVTFASGIATMEVKVGFWGSDDASEINEKVEPIWEAATSGADTYASVGSGSVSETGSNATTVDSMSLLGTEPEAAVSDPGNALASYNIDEDTGYVPGETNLDSPFNEAVISLLDRFS